MLNQFRRFSSGIITKIMVLLLIASFALWGIGDMIGSATKHHSIATIGDETLKVETYYRSYMQQNEQIRRSLGASYSPELLKRLNIPQYVLQQLVQQSLLFQEATRIGFLASDADVARAIRTNPAYRNANDEFDKTRFEAMLRSQGFSEKSYVEKLRREITSSALLFSLDTQVPLNKKALTSLYKAEKQPRNVALYTLSTTRFDNDKAPTNSELEAFYKAHADHYTTPELRTVSYIQLTGNDAAMNVKSPTAQAITDYYNTHQDQFKTEEKRSVDQLLYSSEEDAQKAYALAQSGKSFADIAKALPPLNKDSIALGLVDKKSVLEAAANTIFTLAKNTVSEPISSPFGYHIFYVKAIEPAGIQPLEKVKTTIITTLKQQAEEDALTSLSNALEDALAGGSTLAETAKQLGLTVKQAGTFNSNGKNVNGENVSSIPALDKFVEVAFKTDEKSQSPLITSKGGIYYVLQVDAVKPAALKPLDTVKDAVLTSYKNDQAEQKLSAMVASIENDIAKAKPAKAILASYKLGEPTTAVVSRTSKQVGEITLSDAVIDAIFDTKLASLTNPIRIKNGSYIVAHLLEAPTGEQSAPNEDELKKLSDSLQATHQDEFMQQYLRYLEARYPVSINQEALDQLMQQSDASR